MSEVPRSAVFPGRLPGIKTDAELLERYAIADAATCFVCSEPLTSGFKFPFVVAWMPMFRYGPYWCHPGCNKIAGAERRMRIAMTRGFRHGS